MSDQQPVLAMSNFDMNLQRKDTIVIKVELHPGDKRFKPFTLLSYALPSANDHLFAGQYKISVFREKESVFEKFVSMLVESV